MRIQVFGFFIIFWQSTTLTAVLIITEDLFNVARECKNLDDATLPLLRLKRQLLCNYDSSIHPNYFKNNITTVALTLSPKLMELENDHSILSLHGWISLVWSDPHLAWTPSDYDGIKFIHAKNWKIWLPDLCVYNSGDMSDDQLELPVTKCSIYYEGTVFSLVPVKFVVKCDPDHTYFPFEKYQCRITFGSWKHTGLEIDYQLNEKGISTNDYDNNIWDFKFINAVKEMKMLKCCPNDTFSTIDYNFLLTRYDGTKHITNAIPIIALIILTVTVLFLDPKSVERIALASVNFVCHLLCLCNIQMQLPYNGANTPKILLFYRVSLALATFIIILTVLLRKLEDTNMEMPNWISSATTFVLSNRASRFLILKDNETKVADEDIVTEGNSNVPKSEEDMKESWRHFATIINWLSFICVILTYIITMIIFVPIG